MPEEINFWELDLERDGLPISQHTCLEEKVSQAILTGITEVIGKKSSDSALFMDRVTENIAKDYKDHICSEMFFTLITERLANGYYRSVEQVYHDLE
jgi:Bromodomain